MINLGGFIGNETENKSTILKGFSNSDDLLEKAEGSKGGKIIGHTSSGKAIYESHSNSHLTPDEHKEAKDNHHHVTFSSFSRGGVHSTQTHYYGDEKSKDKNVQKIAKKNSTDTIHGYDVKPSHGDWEDNKSFVATKEKKED